MLCLAQNLPVTHDTWHMECVDRFSPTSSSSAGYCNTNEQCLQNSDESSYTNIHQRPYTPNTALRSCNIWALLIKGWRTRDSIVFLDWLGTLSRKNARKTHLRVGIPTWELRTASFTHKMKYMKYPQIWPFRAWTVNKAAFLTYTWCSADVFAECSISL